MRVESCTICQDKKSVMLTTNQGTLWLYGIAEKIIQCVYTKREAVLAVSAIGITAEAAVELCVESEETAYRISTERVYIEVEKETGKFTWSDARDNTVLLRESGKELADTPLLVYSTGEETPIINRVVTVD